MFVTQFWYQIHFFWNVCVQRLTVSFFLFSVHSLFLELTFFLSQGSKWIKQWKFPQGRKKKKRCCRTPVLEEDPEWPQPFFKPPRDDPSNFACGIILAPWPSPQMAIALPFRSLPPLLHHTLFLSVPKIIAGCCNVQNLHSRQASSNFAYLKSPSFLRSVETSTVC